MLVAMDAEFVGVTATVIVPLALSESYVNDQHGVTKVVQDEANASRTIFANASKNSLVVRVPTT